jgi:hypothetical protein
MGFATFPGKLHRDSGHAGTIPALARKRKLESEKYQEFRIPAYANMTAHGPLIFSSNPCDRMANG